SCSRREGGGGEGATGRRSAGVRRDWVRRDRGRSSSSSAGRVREPVRPHDTPVRWVARVATGRIVDETGASCAERAHRARNGRIVGGTGASWAERALGHMRE